MGLTGKNIKYIIIGAIVLVVIYYFFFKKKEVDSTKKSGEQVNLPLIQQERSVKPAEEEDIQELGTDPTVDPEAKIELGYVGPQDCAENCNFPYNSRVVKCYDGNRIEECLNQANLMKQACLMKCDKSLPIYKNIETKVNTPLQEDNYANTLQSIIASKGYV
jgi:hypothetical protein